MKYILSFFFFYSLICSCDNASKSVVEFLEDEVKVKSLSSWNQEAPDIRALKERNILSVLVKSNGDVLVRYKPRKVSELTTLAKQFIANPELKADLAESPELAIIDLKSEEEVNYAMYLDVYNALKQAYEELWDEKARELYGQPYTMDIPYEQRRIIKQAIPMVLSEAQPTSFKGE